MSKIILPEKKRYYQAPELQEGIDPAEYNGKDIKLPEFDSMTSYGMWCQQCRPYREKMMQIMRELIPEELREQVEIIEKESCGGGTINPFEQCPTIGWKYTPVYHDNMGGQ